MFTGVGGMIGGYQYKKQKNMYYVKNLGSLRCFSAEHLGFIQTITTQLVQTTY